jgi:hypothetical protein
LSGPAVPDQESERRSHPDYICALARFIAGLIALLGTLVLVGWLANVSAFKSVLPGAVEMKPNTAIALVLASISLYLRTGAH